MERGGDLTAIADIQTSIDRALRSGTPIDLVDQSIIAPARVSEEQKAALWLYAWSHLDPRRQRREATEMLARL